MWLKKNNIHYKSIKILNFLHTSNNLNSNEENKIQDENENSFSFDKSLLKYIKNFAELESQFTIQNMSHITKESDIEKYSVKKIEASLLSERDKVLDHLCFPQIFPYGNR